MHLVDKHIFDIQYDSESNAIAMQRKISTISNEKLFELICAVFDEFDTPETVRIDQLELQLGTVRESHLEEDLLDAVANALRIELNDILTIRQSAEVSTTENTFKERSTLAIFEQFIASGTIPWWIRSRNDFNIKKTIAAIFQNQLTAAVAIIRRRAQHPYFLERLVINLDEQQIQALIRNLAPSEANQVIEVAGNIQKIHEKHPIVQEEQRVYRTKVWEFVLTYLLIDRGSTFNQKMFVQSTLARLAHHFNVPYADFLSQFYAAVEKMDEKTVLPTGLVNIIREIYTDRDLPAQRKTESKTIDAEITGVYVQLLESSRNFDTKFEAQIITLIQSNSEVFRSFLNRESTNRQLHKNLALALSDSSIVQLVGFIEPRSKDVIVQFSEKVQDLKEKSTISISGSTQEFRNVTWEFIIRALLADRGSQFNLKSFVKATLQEISAHFNIELDDLMHHVLLELNAHQSINKGALESVLLELKAEAQEQLSQQTDKDEKAFHIKRKLQWMEFALANSQFPAWAERYKINPDDFQTILFELIEEKAPEVKSLLQIHLRENRKRYFFIHQLDERGRHRVVRFLNARAAEKVELYDTLLDKIQERRQLVANKHEFESLKWSSILEILIAEKGSLFNYKSFVLRSLFQLSNRLNLAFDILFSYVLEVSSTLPNIPESPLQNALLGIQEDLKTAADFGVSQNLPLDDHLQKIWKQLEKDVPKEARMLMILLEKSQSEVQFRSQFDLMVWLQKHSSVTKQDVFTIFRALHWNFENVVALFAAQNSNSGDKLLRWMLSDEQTFVPYYLNDLSALIGHLNYSTSILHHHAILFAGAYLAYHPKVDKHLFFNALVIHLSEIAGRKPLDFLTELHNVIKKESPDQNSTLPLSISKAIHGDLKEKVIEKEEKPETEKTPKEEEIEEKEAELEEDDLEGVFIENAGLIIIWPFLRQYFSKLELTENDGFRSVATKIRAVHLLQYICTGETTHAEHDLILNKLLCGLPVNIPIENSFEIQPNEKAITDSVVQGILANWPSMEETSVEALRETFLMRAGKISFEDETVDMHVEKKTVDVLLDRMPWSFTFVNLPWMKKPLRTIWK